MLGRLASLSALSAAPRTVLAAAALLTVGVPGLTLGVEATQGAPSRTGALSYAITDLGTLGGVRSAAWALNTNGDVVGSSTRSDGSQRAYVFREGTMRELPLPGSMASEATGINDVGQIVGVIEKSDATRRGFVYSTIDDVLSVDPVGSSATIPQAINNRGHVTGSLFPFPPDSIQPMRAYLTDGHNGRDLGTLSGGSISVGLGINDRDEVVGWSGLADGHYRAFAYRDGALKDLGGLGGGSSQALWINANGQIVGTADAPGGIAHAFLYGDGRMQDIGGLPGFAFSCAFGINASGQVVGGADQGATVGHAWLWADGSMVDLNERVQANSGWVLMEARAINDPGEIAGNGMIGGQRHAFLLTPETAVEDDVSPDPVGQSAFVMQP